MSRPDPERSIDELDAAICRIASRINAAHYQLLVLVREFDDRMEAKWSYVYGLGGTNLVVHQQSLSH